MTMSIDVRICRFQHKKIQSSEFKTVIKILQEIILPNPLMTTILLTYFFQSKSYPKIAHIYQIAAITD